VRDLRSFCSANSFITRAICYMVEVGNGAMNQRNHPTAKTVDDDQYPDFQLSPIFTAMQTLHCVVRRIEDKEYPWHPAVSDTHSVSSPLTSNEIRLLELPSTPDMVGDNENHLDCKRGRTRTGLSEQPESIVTKPPGVH
jgi:hypothetical protein